MCTLFDDLGFTINREKSSLIPKQQITYLGFVLNSETMTITPNDSKIEKVKILCDRYIGKEYFTIRALAMIIGTLVAASPGNEYGELFYKRMEIYKNKALSVNKGDFDRAIMISDYVKEDLKWWRSNVGSFPVKIEPYSEGLVISSDASKTGWGGEHLGVRTGGLWSDEERTWHINCLELKAALLTLKAFTLSYHNNAKVTLYCDNTTAVSCINKKGSTKEDCNNITRAIWLWCLERNIKIAAVHIPGKENTTADKASREKGLETEWSLDNKIFDIIN